MKQITKRVTYANVMSTIAVFLVLGGATAVAATTLGKNSVGTNQLKKNAVTTAKLRNNAVTAAKIKNGAITGSKINLSTLGAVPSATNAGHATSADTATNANHATTAGTADTANSVAGRIGIARFISEGTTVLATVGPFTLGAECELNNGGNEEARFTLNTTENGSAMDDNNGDEYDEWETSQTAYLFEESDSAGVVDIEAAEEPGLTAIAPSGTAIVFQNETIGFNIAGHANQCYMGGLLEKIG